MASPHNAPVSTTRQRPPDWIRVPLDACTIAVDRKPSVPQTRYKAAGRFPVIDQGAGLIAGYTDDGSVVHNSGLPIILFGDHTRVFKFLDFPFAAGADGTKLFRAHADRVDPRFLYYVLRSLDVPSRGYNRHFKLLREAVLTIPSCLPEQRAIAAVLSRIQAALEVQDGIIARLKELKAATLAKLFREGIVRGLMLDSNVFDEVVDGRLDLSAFRQGPTIYITHVQRDELSRCPDPERRGLLDRAFSDISPKALQTASFVLGASRLGEARLGDAGHFHRLRGTSARHTEDALIAETAIKERVVLVTRDHRLQARARGVGGDAISPDDLVRGRLRLTKQTEIGEIPESWQVERVGDHCEPPRYGHTESASMERVGPKFLRITDITDHGVDWDTVPYCRCPDSTLEQLRLQPGDLLFARIGATTGKSHLVTGCPEAVFASYLIRLRAKARLDPRYLSSFFESNAYWQQIRANKGRNLKGGMSASVLAGLSFPLPSPEEQGAIAESLRQIQHRILWAVFRRNTLRTLFSSMLHLLMTGQVRVPLDLIGRLGALPGAGQGSSGGGGQSRATGQHGKPDEAMLQEIVRRIVAAVAPKEIILFGSAARGEMGPDSDIDLLVVKACEHRREVARAVRDCLRGVAPGRGKDVVVVTPEDVERDRDTIGYIIRPARRDGRVLYAA